MKKDNFLKALSVAFFSLIVMTAALPGAAFAQTPQLFQTRNFVKLRIEKTLPNYRHHNLSLSKNNRAFFFAYNPRNEKIPFGWFKLEGTGVAARPKRIISSSDFSLLFRTAFSPDGNELLTTSKTGEIAVTELKTNQKTTLGAFTTKVGSAQFATFSFPTYTPDGQYILLHNSWENTLLIIDAVTKDISRALTVKGFWLNELGGESPESGDSISVYEFSPDGAQVTFGSRPPGSGSRLLDSDTSLELGTSSKLGKHQILDLTTFKKK